MATVRTATITTRTTRRVAPVRSTRTLRSRTHAKATTPWMAIGLGALALGLAVKGLLYPPRGLAASGEAKVCPDGFGSAGCSDSIELALEPGAAVYSAISGKVITVRSEGDHMVMGILGSFEPALTVYDFPPGATALVKPGDGVWLGQQIATAPGVRFAVQQVLPKDSSGAGPFLQPLDPLAWLISRGRPLTASGNAGAICGLSGRSYEQPAPGPGCGPLSLPELSQYLVLPTNVRQKPWVQGAPATAPGTAKV